MPEKLLFSHFLTKGLFSSDTEFVDGLKYRFHQVKRAEDNIEDVYGGSLYQSKSGPGGFFQNHITSR